MYIFVDESGTFTTSTSAPVDSWCVVVAYLSPEKDQDRLTALVAQLRKDHGDVAEVKLHQFSEARYIRFLRDLSRLNGLVFAVALDVSLHPEVAVVAHRAAQADRVIEHREKMIHAQARDSLTALSESIRSLPAQLYTQLQCQVELFHKVLTRATVYYSRHWPESLANLRWRVDQKDTIPTAYEIAFRTILPAVLQTKSLRDPMIQLVEGDYSFFQRYAFPAGQYPTYLEEHYGIESSGQGMNVGQMVREDFQLVDSKEVSGVQVADLISSGLRRLLRGGFTRSHEVALGLGENMLSILRGETQIGLVSLAHVSPVSVRTAATLKLLARKAKPLV